MQLAGMLIGFTGALGGVGLAVGILCALPTGIVVTRDMIRLCAKAGVWLEQHALEPDGEYGPLTNASLTAELERLENPAHQNCVRIVGGNCYVRVQPNTDAEKLGVAHRDTLLPYQGEIAANGWLKVSFNGQDGWVSGKYGRICG